MKNRTIFYISILLIILISKIFYDHYFKETTLIRIRSDFDQYYDRNSRNYGDSNLLNEIEISVNKYLQKNKNDFNGLKLKWDILKEKHNLLGEIGVLRKMITFQNSEILKLELAKKYENISYFDSAIILYDDFYFHFNKNKVTDTLILIPVVIDYIVSRCGIDALKDHIKNMPYSKYKWIYVQKYEQLKNDTNDFTMRINGIPCLKWNN